MNAGRTNAGRTPRDRRGRESSSIESSAADDDAGVDGTSSSPRRQFLRSAVAASLAGLSVTGPALAEPSPSRPLASPQNRATPPLTERQRLTSSDADRYDTFGYRVAVSADGTTALVGARGEGNAVGEAQGAGYVFAFDGTQSTETQKLTASDASKTDFFGSSVALNADGTTALVAPGPAGPRGDGTEPVVMAYVFALEDGRWAETQKLTSAPTPDDHATRFHVAVNAAGSTALVGSNRGAYVFESREGEWVETQRLTASSTALGDYHDGEVALNAAGTTALVGAPLHDTPAGEAAGATYVFAYDGTTWIETQKLTASDAGPLHRFGRTLALTGDGTTALVGAPAPRVTRKGSQRPHDNSAHVFAVENGRWVETQRLIPGEASRNGAFGWSVALTENGTTALVGAPEEDAVSTFASGSAYVFASRDGEWVETQRLTADDPATNDYFGHSVALTGAVPTAFVSAPWVDTPAGEDAGEVYVYKENVPPTSSHSWLWFWLERLRRYRANCGVPLFCSNY